MSCFPPTMRLHFAPLADAATAQVFADDIARTLYLLWRSRHIIDQHFSADCLAVALAIRRTTPQTVDDLRRCFSNRRAGSCADGNTIRFCQDALPFFIGDRRIGYRVEVPE